MQPEVYTAPSLLELSKKAVDLICRTAKQSVADRGIFTLVLTGGNTPRMLYDLLANSPNASDMPWEQTHLFWGDERWVPADHPDSNFGMAYTHLISNIDIPPSHVHPIQTDLDTPEDAASAYEDVLSFFLKDNTFRFDIVLLGMGKDGHTASLFPKSPILHIDDRLVETVPPPATSPSVERITLTVSALNRSETVLFLISGAEKNKILKNIVKDPKNAAMKFPAAQIQPRKKLFWFTTKN